MPREGEDPQRTPGTISALPHIGQGSDLEEGDPPPPVMYKV